MTPSPPFSHDRPAAPATDTATVDADRFKAGMRALASGVALVSTLQAGRRHGLVATSLSSLACDPPSLLVCVNRSSSAHEPIVSAGVFGVSLLGARHRAIAEQFGDPGRRDERFTTGEWTAMRTGAPMLDGALALLDCEIDRRIDYASHSIFIARVVELRIGENCAAPLVYFDRAFAELPR